MEIMDAIVSVVVALIAAGGSLIGVLISNRSAAQKTEATMQAAQAVTDEKLTELTREVRKHNNFAERMPVVEEQIKVINHRIHDLEEFHKPT